MVEYRTRPLHRRFVFAVLAQHLLVAIQTLPLATAVSPRTELSKAFNSKLLDRLEGTRTYADVSPILYKRMSDDCPACPSCFDCHLSMNKCTNGGACEETGRCKCLEGFGGEDCSTPACGSPALKNRPLSKGGQKCECDDGWTGVNCNVCETDIACKSYFQKQIEASNGSEELNTNSTCVKSGVTAKEHYQWCEAMNIPWISGARAGLYCTLEPRKCFFNFWIDKGGIPEETFYCDMSGCSQTTSTSDENSSDVHWTCPDMKCSCVEGSQYCNPSGMLDLHPIVERVKGPSEWFCKKNGTDCIFFEYSTLKTLFASGIKLICQYGECALNSQLAPKDDDDTLLSVWSQVGIAVATLVFLVLMAQATRALIRQQRFVSTGKRGVSRRRPRQGGLQLPLSQSFSADAENPQYEGDENINLGATDFDDPDLGPATGLRIGTGEIRTADSPILTASLLFSDVGYIVDGKPLLTDVSGIVHPGQLCALMGPSGAGKTSCLDILAKKEKRGTVTGKILVNGRHATRKDFHQITGYVDQEDTLMGTLTVRETLMYSALLRLPRTMPVAVKQQHVEDAMAELGISHLADKKVGAPGSRGLSGGEKRRVSIAQELVTSPSILFLDEPTSGLDSYNAHAVMECIASLAHDKKRTVVVTIHQPRSDIYRMFDQLILLAGGDVVYQGPAQTATDYFASIGYMCPSGYNVADFLIDLTMQQHPSPSSLSKQATSPYLRTSRISDESSTDRSSSLNNDDLTRYRDSPERHEFSITDLASLMENPLYPGEVYRLTEVYRRSDIAKSIRDQVLSLLGPEGDGEAQEPGDESEHASQSKVGLLYQFAILSTRTFANLYRDPFLLIAHLVVSVALALLCGVLFWKVEDDLPGVQNRLGCLFFICALLGFGSLSTLDTFAKERLIFIRERANGFYQPGPYFLSKVAFDIVLLRVVPPLIMGSICYYMIGLSPSTPCFVRFLLVLVLTNCTAAGMCLCVATLVQSAATANLLCSLGMLFSMLFGGFLLNKEHIPSELSWVQYLSFFNYAYEALITNELNHVTLHDRNIIDIKVPGTVILDRFGFDTSGYWKDVSLLGLIFLMSMGASFLFLKTLVKERR